MQSGYGGVSEIQQFMVDGCPSSLFSISTPLPNPNAAASSASEIHTAASQHHKFYSFPHPHHPHHQQQQQQQHHHPPPPPPHFSYFHPIPITQQLFQQTHHHHQFQLFHHQQQQMGLDQESGPENSNSPARLMGRGGGGGGGPPFLAAAMNFKLGVDESSGGGGGGGRDGLNEDDGGILHGDDGSESRLHSCWHREDQESNIKEPFWRPLDLEYINRNNKRPAKEKQPEISNKYCKKNKEGIEHHQGATTDSNYKLFSELEAIYKPGGGDGGNNQTGSGSALTGDDNPLVPTTAPGPTVDHQPDHGSDTSNGGDAPPPLKKIFQKGSSSGGRRKRNKQRKQQQLSSIASFFESLIKQLMDHQGGLHQKFLEVMERRDQERTIREEAWRKQEAAKSSRETVARAQERALAATREAAIISFLEKFIGERLNLPTKLQFRSQLPDESPKDQEENPNNLNYNALEPYSADGGGNNTSRVQLNSSRWPKAEVQALIRVRSSFESRFQEPGLKGPLWEEVSSTMASMGYHRRAKRCKEKWENINKYFRKTKDSGKKRPQHSKTCPYFHLLDQLYSKSLSNPPLPSSSNNANVNQERKDNSELLDAIVVSTDHQSFKFPEMGSLRIEFNSKPDGGNEAGGGSGMAGKRIDELGGQRDSNEVNNDDEDEDDDDEEEGGDGEGEGESQDRENLHREQHHHLNKGEENPQHDSTLFLHRLRS